MTTPLVRDPAVETQTPSPEGAPAAPRLPRRLGQWDCLFLVIGSMVGSGIFLTTGQIAGALPVPWMILAAWLIGGLMALSGALTYAELGAALPRAGGHYTYLREAYGPLVGFLDGWLSVLASFPGSIAFVALGLTTYLPPPWSGQPLATFGGAGLHYSLTSTHLTAVGIILVLSLLNALGVRAGSGTQNLLTGLKLAALAAFIGLGLVSGGGDWHHLAASGLLQQGGAGLAGFGAALIGVSFAYLGWDAATYMAAEVRDPQRSLPRSLAMGTALVIVVYLGFNAVLLYGLTPSSLAASSHGTPDALLVLLGPAAAGLLTGAIIVTVLGSLNATIMVGPRISYAMARDGLFPQALGGLHPRTQTPLPAIMAQAGLACVIALSSTLGGILAFTVLVIWVLSAATGLAVFVLRRRRPDLPRPYRVWGYPWVPAIFCLSSLALIVDRLLSSPLDALWLAGFVVAGLPVYAMMKARGGGVRDTGPGSAQVSEPVPPTTY